MTGVRVAIGVCAAAWVASCAGLADIPATEWESARTHVLKDIDKKRVFAAAEKVFRLADGNDFKFSYSGDGETLVATQRYVFTIVISTIIGRNTWTVRLKQVGNDVHGRVNMAHYDKTLGTNPIERWQANGGGAATYRTFWRRVDYVLGRSDKWPTCSELKSAFRRNKSRLTQYTGWCAPWFKDRKPERLAGE